ncbi:MAG: hypothetical protein IJG16_13185 [Clostridia bacterium]|nr:hypothetical protein [Clostridia bacterium]
MKKDKFYRLKKSEPNNYSVTAKLPYQSVHPPIEKETVENVFNFAYSMSYGGKGKHRPNRSGGKKKRGNREIFIDAFQGKLAECALFKSLYKLPGAKEPDFDPKGLGEWDTVDIVVLGKDISIKSTKYFGQLLLLEQDDWDENGFYIPNKKNYDYLALVRIKPSCDNIIKEQYPKLGKKCDDKERLKDIICSQLWTYDYAGYITYNELKYIITNKYMIPQGAALNGKIIMDAANYYVQAYDMNRIDENGDWLTDKKNTN